MAPLKSHIEPLTVTAFWQGSLPGSSRKMAPARAESLRPGLAHKTAFNILEDGADKTHLYPPADKDVNSLSRALGELVIENCQNIPLARNDSDPKSIKAQIEQHVPRLQRPALSAYTFEPLAALDENSDSTFTQQRLDGMTKGCRTVLVAFTDTPQLQIAAAT